MRNPSLHAFSLENGAAQLEVAFDRVALVRVDPPVTVRIRDEAVVADYVASIHDHYEQEVDRLWSDVVDAVRADVRATIERDGEFVTRGDAGLFYCE